jgi:hypothetical protein
MSPCATVPTAAGTFFPLRTFLRLDNHNFSPALLQRIVEAAAHLGSFADASFALHLAGVIISSRQVQRIAVEIGSELARQRDRKVWLRRRRQLLPRVSVTPAVVAVEVDGGRLRSREPGCGPGVHHQQGKEDKVACLVTLQSRVYPQDPQPQPPAAFLEPRRVQRLVQQLKGHASDKPQDEAEKEPAPAGVPEPSRTPPRPGAPHRLVRTCVASLADSHRFGPMVAAEAQERDFYRAGRRAFLGDGARYNWWIQKVYFADFEAIVDLLHVLCYLYLAAWAVGADETQGWSLYTDWLRWCWQGRVHEVIAALQSWQGRIGKPSKGEEVDEQDPRRLVAEALSYLKNNQSRMDYPRYRRQGLPITSSLAESLVGQINARVKAPQKFWNRPEGAEAILQLRALVLSEDDRLARYFAQRPGNPHRRGNPAQASP